MTEIRACMYDLDRNPIKVPPKVFDRMVAELKAKGRQVCFEAPGFRLALGTTIAEKTDVEGGKIFCNMFVPSRVVKWLERGKPFRSISFVEKVLMTPEEAGLVIPATEPLPPSDA